VPIAKRQEIVDLYANARMKPSDIVRTTGVPRRTVFSTIARWKAHGCVEDLPRKARPRKTSPEVDLKIVRRARHHPFEPPKAVIAHLGLDVCARTVRRRWREHGIRRFVARKTVLMAPKHLKARLDWCLDHRAWSKEQWRQVIWSDERTFRLGKYGRIWVSRPCRKRNAPQFTKAGTSRGPKLMIWARMDGRGKFGYTFVEGTIRKEEYKEVLQRALLPYTRCLRRDGRPFVFMQDRAPPHKAKMIFRWLDEQHVPVLPWFAKGADLNPIENLWNVIGEEVQRQTPRNLQQLRAAIERACAGVDAKLIVKLIDSMPNRVAQVIERRGLSCNY
jgi:hypothetical protein